MNDSDDFEAVFKMPASDKKPNSWFQLISSAFQLGLAVCIPLFMIILVLWIGKEILF